MKAEINRLQWKCRRGMREIDLLLREFSAIAIDQLDEKGILTFDEVLNYDDQTLFDFIFKNESLGNTEHENFINKHLKKFTKQGNF
tara:strand:+ start:101 stop:358 length:258 start_codon:yes stop_codon:yes gene_type:complete